MLSCKELAELDEKYNNNPDSLSKDEMLAYFTDLFDDKYEITTFDMQRFLGVA